MAAPKKYDATLKGVMMWAQSELEHVGRIAALRDEDLQYSYALSTVNGMAHLKDALHELAQDEEYSHHKRDILKKHDAVIRVMKHIIREYNVDLDTIRNFNVRKVLSSLNYLSDSKGAGYTRRKNKNKNCRNSKTRKN
jgi:hypothetical protein